MRNDFLDRPITMTEVRNAIKKIKKNRQTPGGISIEFLKYCTDDVFPLLTALFKFYFEHG